MKRHTKAPFLAYGGALLLAIGIGFALLGAGSSLANTAFIAVGVLALSEGAVRKTRFIVSRNSDEARERLATMIGGARQHVMLTTGNFSPEAYIRWQDGRIKNLIEAKLADGVEIEVVTGNELSPESKMLLSDLVLRFENFRVTVYRGNPVPHGLLVDDRELRVEKPHSAHSPERQNIYIRRPITSAAMFRRTFQKYVTQGKPMTPGPYGGRDG